MEKYFKEIRKHRIMSIREYYLCFFRNARCYVPSSEYSYLPCAALSENVIWDGNRGDDDNHFTMNPSYLFIGLKGVADECRKNAQSIEDSEAKLALEATADIYDGACEFLSRHAECARALAEGAAEKERQHYLRIEKICNNLSHSAPATLEEAIALFWVCWRIRSNRGTATIGRLDQYFYPFYKADLENGRITPELAKEYLRDLWVRINDTASGDTLINVMLGGSDGKGNDQSNELSLLMMDVHMEVRRTEPHINVRFHKNVNEEFYKKSLELQLLGHGQATVFNDDVVIPSLVEHGIAFDDAINYSNDGCTEIIVDGKSVIRFFNMEALKCMELTMFNGEEAPTRGEPITRLWSKNDRPHYVWTNLELGHKYKKKFEELESLEEVYLAVEEQYEYQLRRHLRGMHHGLAERKTRGVSSLFVQGASPEFRKSGVDFFRNSEIVHINDAFLGAIPTLADSIAAVGYAVFDKKICTMDELIAAVGANYVGYEDLRLKLKAAPKFGNDDDYVDNIAARLATKACEIVEDMNKETGDNILPALFCFLFNKFAKIVGPTPDGRRWKDPMCEHYSPTPGCARSGPGAQILSAAKGPLTRAIGDSPLYVSIPRNVVPENEAGYSVLDSLNQSSMALGLPILNIAIYDTEVLKAAKLEPEKYGDIIVRVWGYSARFVDLDSDMQDHIIARASIH